jgi:hypothetical protein
MSKFLRLTNCTNLLLSSALRESKLVRTTLIPLRFYTTEQPAQPPKPPTPPTSSSSSIPPKPDATKKEQPGKGKGTKNSVTGCFISYLNYNYFIGPITWKSLSIAAALGGCLLVNLD